MSITDLNIYDSNGRIRGCSVYMLLCKDDGPYYIKVGVSKDPTKRLEQLRTGCGVTPRYLFYVPLWSRKTAYRVENQIHRALIKWATVGEWFKVTPEDKAEFNAAIRAVLERYKSPGYPMEWERAAVKDVMHLSAVYQKYRVTRRKKGGAIRLYAQFRREAKEAFAHKPKLTAG